MNIIKVTENLIKLNSTWESRNQDNLISGKDNPHMQVL